MEWMQERVLVTGLSDKEIMEGCRWLYDGKLNESGKGSIDFKKQLKKKGSHRVINGTKDYHLYAGISYRLGVLLEDKAIFYRLVIDFDELECSEENIKALINPPVQPTA